MLLRNVGGLSLDPNTDEVLNGLAAEMGKIKPELVAGIVGEWLMANAYLPVPHALDQESAVEGNA
ncbi:MAG: hypothetical protein E5V92_04555 [Mesorhizobium sp.]|uniref:hypothetical protein n=1 Tax=unclassified Mesorhizobium TaxID=325217 RepID=UPI000F74DEA8|nr:MULTISPECIES: hypothetical protein [unclassified Mesorhizobium]AZO71270.1 hypothetical protein EJ067_08770 [Mesorhizobium sp. M1D.F.Ca.ET.043.01.1.1]RWA94555.1 MAG: hypothetical protein EOQ32_12090 [Mesorhizobium sp.]RWE17520.1 MAG: hypothetical protein EOS61_02570 [Mesorhizobium sp.]TIW00007.1 MAG: hypothetical protein E5V85_05620 [Mesorhizobium sp.]TJW88857.1 MAG: hypothetical protein E5V92_04555 [Mesorhizobium sp.]